ncbi:MAG: hypothetical protein QW455_03810 [Archaeoglobaceae archaeon]
MEQRKAFARIKADDEEFSIEDGKIIDSSNREIKIEEINSKEFSKVEILVLEPKRLTWIENMPVLDFISSLKADEIHLNELIIDNEEVRKLKTLLKCFLNAEFFGKRSEKIFEEFWVLKETAEKLKNAKIGRIFSDLLEEIARISGSLSQFRNIFSDIEYIENSKLREILEEILKAIWLYLHSAIRFGANEKLLALNLLSSTIDRIETTGVKTFKILIESLADKQMEDNKAKKFAKSFFLGDQDVTKIKNLRNKSPLSHGGTEVDLKAFIWEDFIRVYKRISEILKYLSSIKFTEKEESDENSSENSIIEQILEVFNEKLIEDVKTLGSLIKNLSILLYLSTSR